MFDNEYVQKLTLQPRAILAVSPAYPPPLIGGSIVYMYSLLENSELKFDILTSKMKQFNPLTKQSKNDVIRKKWIHFSNNPSNIVLLLSYFYQLYWIIINRKKYNLILANTEVIQNSFIILISSLLKIKVIPFSYGEELTIPLKNKSFKSRIKKFLLKKVYPRADWHISCCHFARDILSKQFSVDENLIDVVPVPFNSQKIKNIENLSNRPFNYQLLSVGRLVKRKGFMELLDVVKILKEEYPLIKLNIVGSGPLEEALKAKVIKEELQNYVTIHGRVSDDKLNSLYLSNDIFILAHRMLKNGDTEGSPTTFAEAGIFKLPSIGGKNSGASTIIEHNKTGFVIDMKDESQIISTIKKLFENKNLINKMGDAAYKKITKYHNPKFLAEKFTKVLVSL